MALNKNSTRYASSVQEKSVASAVGGKRTPNSGATDFQKGDVITTDWLLECKTCMEKKKSFSIKKEWLEKNKQEAFATGKENHALVFDFGDSNRYYVLDEKTFLKMKEVLDNGN